MVENVPPGKTWEALQHDPQAQLVDVRTDAEWNFVGIPDLAKAGKQAVLIPWQVYPTMQRNAKFETQLREAGFTAEHHIYFLCRSGVRSLAAAETAPTATTATTTGTAASDVDTGNTYPYTNTACTKNKFHG